MAHYVTKEGRKRGKVEACDEQILTELLEEFTSS